MSSAKTAAAITAVSVTAIANDFVASKNLKSAQSDAYYAQSSASLQRARAEEWKSDYYELLKRGKSSVHSLRAWNRAHRKVEEELIAIIKEAYPNHPIADMDVIERIARYHRKELFFSDIEMIKITYPDGNVPEDSYVIEPNGEPCSLGGQPANPWQIGAKERADAYGELMIALGVVKDFDEFNHRRSVGDIYHETISDAEALERRAIAKVAELKKVLTDDDQKGFFTSMNKKKRAAAEEELAKFEKHAETAKWVVKDAYEAVAEAERAAAVKIRVDAKLAELERMGFGDYAIRPEPGLKG